MISRREWLALVGKLGVIGAAAAVGLGAPAHAVTRPTATLNPLFLNVPPRVPISQRTAPRLVQNRLSGGNGVVFGYDRYYKGTGSSWGDNPTDTSAITWGYDEDGGQWFECNTTSGGPDRVWASFTFTAVVGVTYLVSCTVDSKSGTHGNNGHILLASGTFTGGVSVVNNPAVGRYAVGGLCTSGGTITVRIGIGTNSANNFNATMRFSDVMLEIVPPGRTYPSEYVRPGDQQVFAYTRTSTVTSGAESNVVVGSTYPIPARSSVLVIGDSWANDIPFEAGGDFGDFPWQTRRFLRPHPIALNAGGFAGHTIDQITGQIATAVTRQADTPTASPYTLCVAHGGTNDLAASRTLVQMQASRLAQIAAIEAAGMRPILVTVPPYNSLSAGNQTTMDAYNAWLKTLGYPLYDLFTDATDGSNDLKSSWDYGDGIHASITNVGGAARYGRRLAELILLIGD